MIVAAYKDRAIQACQKDAMTASLGLAPQAWGNASSVKLVIGKGNLNVQFWQVDDLQAYGSGRAEAARVSPDLVKKALPDAD